MVYISTVYRFTMLLYLYLEFSGEEITVKVAEREFDVGGSILGSSSFALFSGRLLL
jgi:hypothetical protein